VGEDQEPELQSGHQATGAVRGHEGANLPHLRTSAADFDLDRPRFSEDLCLLSHILRKRCAERTVYFHRDCRRATGCHDLRKSRCKHQDRHAAQQFSDVPDALRLTFNTGRLGGYFLAAGRVYSPSTSQV